ncbi:hypothetical protein LCGC14_2079370, partial [marine sediment metagenome]
LDVIEEVLIVHGTFFDFFSLTFVSACGILGLMMRGRAVWLARRAHNPEVASSNLAPAMDTRLSKSHRRFR